VSTPIPEDPRADCPEIEQLAAFVDGALGSAERAQLIEHLDECDACREIVADTASLSAARLKDAEGSRAPRVRDIARPPARRRNSWVAAAGFVLVAGSGLLLWQHQRDFTSEALTRITKVESVRDSLGKEWNEPHWSVMRSTGPNISERARAFRLGARAAALEVALGISDRLAARSLAAEMALLVGNEPLTEPIARIYREIADGLAAEGASTSAHRKSAQIGASLSREAFAPELWELGRWAETGRIIADSGRQTLLPRPPRHSAPYPPEVEGLVTSLALHSRTLGTDSALSTEFERLLAVGGELE
jgi:hypothetical protein